MRAGLLLASMGAAMGAALGQVPDAPYPTLVPQERALPDRIAEKPSQPPAYLIPVAPLGFSAPGAINLGLRNSVVSLDFLDEGRLLFTFRVPGLVHRGSVEYEERQIRAVVLTLPAGAVEAEALWTVHDRQRYLWALSGSHFLLRDRNNLEMGDATLGLKPFLRFPGPLLWLEMDPTQQIIVTNSREPAAGSHSGDAGGQAARNVYGQKTEGESDLEVRVLRRDSGQVMLVSRARSTVHLPINSEGYLESLRGRAEEWVLNLNFFTGGSRVLGSIDSACAPTNEFISQQEVLVTACDGSGGHKLIAITTGGKILWSDLNRETAIWPILTHSPNGLRLTQETLAVTHPISAFAPLGSDDIKGQLVRVFDAATGEVAFEAPASPIFDDGGNTAISPSGQRVAVLNGGTIQVFELPAPPPLPDVSGKQAAH